MEKSGVNLFQMMQTKLGWLGAAQAVTARNLANADTPGYVASELKPLSFESLLGSSSPLALSATSAGHRQAPGGEAAAFGEERQKESWESSPTGNGVVLEEQMMKAADQAADYQLMLNLYKKQVGMMKIALGR